MIARLKEAAWRLLARTLGNNPELVDRLVARAKATPYIHLTGYMNRWWLFNPYQDAQGNYVKQNWLMSRLPSIRVHEILRADIDQHLHDHPWDARTIILRDGYLEELQDGSEVVQWAGDTRAIRFGEYHRIVDVPNGTATTLFFTWKYMGVWGFLVAGHKVPWREYLDAWPARDHGSEA